MNKILNKKIFNRFLLGSFVAFAFANSVFAINLEYKNSLSRVELSKMSDDSYTINLYTSKKFLDPVKVIKKNDLSYYILLPETKNSATVINSSSQDIRNVTANSYSYAGQDVNNGYTKINITTTKPINFNINVKNSTQNSISQAPQQKAIQAPVPLETQVQKKNSQNEKNSSSNIKAAAAGKIIPKTSQKTVILPKTLEELNAEKKPKKVEEKQKPKQKIEPKKQIKTSKPVLEKAIVKKTIENTTEDKVDLSEQTPQISEQIINDFEEAINSENTQDEILEDSSYQEEPQNLILSEIKQKALYLLKKADNFADRLNVSLVSLLGMVLSGLVVFCVVLFALTRKQKQTPKIQKRVDLADKKVSSKRSVETKRSDEYFVFDKNVKTVLKDPSTSAVKKNYELSSYDPELKNYEKLKKTRLKCDKPESEYDIIQKILREDSLIDVSSGEYDVMDGNSISQSQQPKREKEILIKQMQKEKVELKQADIVTSPIVKEEMKVELQQGEPQVLSKVEIAPEKGFMCVSYNDNISLVGYIFDDVFAIYNFKCSKLENYEIKYRLSDKDEYGANFIVKVDKVKVVVNVAKSSMKLQVVM